MNLWDNETPGYELGVSNEIPTMTPYLLQTNKLHGAIIVFPGGGYVGRADHEGEPIARWLNSIGLSAVVVHYRVAPTRHPYPLMDAKRAIKLVRYHAEDWNLDPHRIGILGFSAGGHLAASLSTHFDEGTAGGAEDPVEALSSRPDAAVLCYPVISFGEHRHHGSMINLLGDNASDELIQDLSNELMVTPNTPPTFLWHTADDGAVPVENSLLYAGALSRNKVPFELHVFPEGSHGLGLALGDPHVAQWTKLCERWFGDLGFLEHNRL